VPALPVSAVWIRPKDILDAPNPSLELDKLVAGKIKFLFLLVGEWEPDGIISYFSSDSRITNFINTVKERNSDFKVLAWVYGGVPGYQDPVDISTAAKRQNAINQIVSCVNKGFDGFNEDIETYVGTTQNLIDFWNGMAATLRGMNKISTVDAICTYVYPVEDIYPYLDVDYIAPMLYGGGAPFPETDFKNVMHRVLTNTGPPILIGMKVNDYTTIPLNTQLGWIDSKIASSGPYPKLKGFVLWEYQYMRDVDWTDWNNWATKDL
jgi:hypothetical protein